MTAAPHRITKIEAQKKNPDRVNVCLDGVFAFGLDREVVVRHALYEGDTLSKDTINHVLLTEETIRAKSKALSLLSYRARSVKEIKDRLKGKDFSDRVISVVVDDLLHAGLLDDRQFAASFTHTRMIQKPVSKNLLVRELGTKGIDRETAETAVEEVYEGRSETEVARELYCKRIKRFSQIDEKAIKNLSDFLLRRGFGWDIISDIIPKDIY